MSAYLIPPINAEAINTTNARFGISEAMLVSSSVPETPAAAYVAGTSYALNAECSTGTAGGVITCWLSLQAANVGHTPASSPTWWKNIGTTYSVWEAATSWATGARVIRPVADVHAVFERLGAGGVDAALPEADATKWFRVSATNRWAMFDMLGSVRTAAVSPLTFTLAPGRVSALALVDASGGTVSIAMTGGGGPVYAVTSPLDATVIASWEDYFFADFAPRSNFLRLDVPMYSDGQITVTVTEDSGALSLGKCVVGIAQTLGSTNYGPRVRRKSYSLVNRDDFGDLQGITRRKSIALVSQTFFTEKSEVLKAKAALDAARTTPCIVVGLDNDQDEYAELLTLLAICNDSEVNLSNPMSCDITAEFEGI